MLLRWTGVMRRPVVSASYKSENPLQTHLYHNAAQTFDDDVIDHVTLQQRTFHVNRLVSKQQVFYFSLCTSHLL